MTGGKISDGKAEGQGRRDFLRSAAVSTFLGGTVVSGAASVAACSSQPSQRDWNQTADVVIVGSGAAGLTAAIAAIDAGRSVILVEAGPAIGGTTIKSDGGYWIPNNRLMREKGVKDDRDEAISFMLAHAYPASFNPAKTNLGIEPLAYDLIATFFDKASDIVENLEEKGILQYTGFPLIDYYDSPDNKSPYGRTLLPMQPDGNFGPGRELVRQLQAPLVEAELPILLKHRVTALERNSDGQAIGVIAESPDGEVRIRANRAVIFGTGGFSQNPEMVTRFQPGPIYGGCAVPTNQGDFVRIGSSAGAMLGNMHNAWRAQVVIDDVVKRRSIARDIFHIPGDSMFLVNRFGRRVMNEKRDYNDRTKVHYDWDAAAAGQSNRLLFMIYDDRTRQKYAGNSPIPPKGEDSPHQLTANTITGLADAIRRRLSELAENIGPYPLDDRFNTTLSAQVEEFNRIAASGIDPVFRRGASTYDKEWHTGYAEVPPTGNWPDNPSGNLTFYPMSDSGPYYAVILAPGALDTNGGPQIDTQGRVLSSGGGLIPGLYGAGNCIASPAGSAYWGAGTTLGLAITYGYIAGQSAAAESVKSDA